MIATKAEFDVKVVINNVPGSVVNGTVKGLIVARVVEGDLWYYGCYDTKDKASEAAKEIGGIVLEVS